MPEHIKLLWEDLDQRLLAREIDEFALRLGRLALLEMWRAHLKWSGGVIL
jgi:hypothetical protein